VIQEQLVASDSGTAGGKWIQEQLVPNDLKQLVASDPGTAGGK
jgi:hypothetical protein